MERIESSGGIHADVGAAFTPEARDPYCRIADTLHRADRHRDGRSSERTSGRLPGKGPLR